MTRMNTRTFTRALLQLALGFTFALQGIMAHAQDDTVLRLDLTAQGGTVHEFTLTDLEALEAAGFTTTTNWTEDETAFTGVALITLLDQMDIREGTLELNAANEYFVEIPVSEAREDAALIAYRMNGETMSRRDKGPLWLVYPYDADRKYRTELYFSRSIWQLSEITLLFE